MTTTRNENGEVVHNAIGDVEVVYSASGGSRMVIPASGPTRGLAFLERELRPMVDLMVIKPGGFPELVSIPRAGVVEGLMELIGGRYHFYSLPGTRYVVMHANRLHPEATAFVEGEHERFNFFGTIVLARVSSARGVETLNDADINNLNIITTEGPLQLPAMIERRSENHEGLNNKG